MENTLVAPTPKTKRLQISSEKGKGVISISLLAISLICFVFCSLFSKNQLADGISVSFNGLDLLAMLFKGGEYMLMYNMDDGKGNPFEMELTIQYPMLMCYLTLIALVLLIGLLVFQVLRYTKLKGNARVSKISAYANFAVSAVLVAVYVYLLFCKVEAFDFYGDETEFYRVFEVKVTILLVALCVLANGFIELKLQEKTIPLVKRFLPIYGFMIIPLALIFIFNLYPILLQTVMSFKNYTLSQGVWGGEWVGFQHFKTIFTDSSMLTVIGRTVYISLIRLFVGIIPPLILSVCLYDLKSTKARSVFQNIVYIPHFFSWVVVYAICYSLLSPEGLMNSMFGSTTDYMVSEQWFLPIVIISAVWKELGWGTILYLAALSGVDVALYEAAKIDGATPIQRIVHITIPSIKNTIIFLTIMSLGNVLKGAGGEQLLLFYSATTKEQALVIDTWLVWEGITKPENYSLGAAMSFFQSGIGMVMVLGFNWFSKKFFEVSIW